MPDRATGSPPRSHVLAAYAAVYVIWGSTYLAIHFAVQTLPPFLMAGVRFLAAGTILYAFMRLSGRAPRPTLVNWRAAFVVGGLLLLGGNGGVVWAQLQVPSGIAALLVATVPLWMVVLDWLRPGGRRPTLRVAAGIALGLVGLGVLVGPGMLHGEGNVNPAGAIVLLLASLSWAAGSLWASRAALPRAPALATGMEMLGGGSLLLLVGLLSGEAGRVDLASASPASLSALLYLIVFGSLVGFSAYVWLLAHEPPARAATYAYVNPVVAVFLGWLLAGERLTGATLMAAAIIIGAVVLIITGRTTGTGEPPSRPAARPEPAGVRAPVRKRRMRASG